MSTAAASKTKFSIVCCEETEVTKQISRAVSEWQLPGVRSLLVNDQPAAQLLTSDENDVAQSDYAIFITPHERPSSQVKIGPLNAAQEDAEEANKTQSPATLLADIHSRHGQSPQSWWLQLPTTELRAQKVHPVASAKSVAQALSQIEVFVRNYRLAVTPRAAGIDANKAINSESKQVVLAH